jgi:hypothetical protein
MARDPYSAAAAGLESGFGLGMRAREQERAEKRDRDAASERAAERTAIDEQRVYQRSRDVKADERAAKQDEERAKAARRQEGIDKLRVLDSEIDELGKEGTALWSQYGGYDKVPEDVRGDFVKRTKEARGRRSAARRSFYEPDVQATRREAAETASRLEAGQLTLDQLTPDQLYKTIQVQARRPMADFIRTDPAKPSAIEQAGLDLEAGMQTGNRDMIMRAANVLLAPELKVGIGSEGRDGSEIIEKKIVQLVPHPQDPNQIVPLLEVKVRRDDGSIGSYLAPVTEGRGVYGSDPQATPKAITMQAALDRVGQLTTTAAFVNRPDVRKFIDQAGEGKASADEFLASMGLLGIAPPKKQVTRERVDLGGSVLERTVDASGQILGEQRLGKTAAPRAAGEGGGDGKMTAEERQILRAQKLGLISEQEAGTALRNNALGLKPGGDEKSTEGERKAATLLTRLRSSQAQLNSVLAKKPGAAKPGVLAESARAVLGDTAANLANDEARQQVEAAQLDMLDAALTLGTGAAYTREQLMGYRRSYFPQIGDNSETVKDKQDRLQAVIEAAEIAAGNVAKKVPAFTPGSRKQRPPAGGAGGSWEGLPTAVNPKTGERVVFKDGQWQPAK